MLLLLQTIALLQAGGRACGQDKRVLEAAIPSIAPWKALEPNVSIVGYAYSETAFFLRGERFFWRYDCAALGLLPKPAQGRCPWTPQGASPLDPSALARWD